MENRNNKFRRKYFSTIDRLLIRLAIVTVILLLAAQTLLLNGETRKYLSLVDKLEGEQINSPTVMYAGGNSVIEPAKPMDMVSKVIAKSIRTLRSGKNITIRMITPAATSDAVVTVNGEVVGNFAKERVDVTIFEGDYIEIDVTNAKKPAQFIIDTHNSDLLAPADGILLETKSNIISVGKVIVKR